MPATAHIDENQLLQLIDGALTPADVEHLEDHVDQCAACGELMVRVARELTPARDARPDDDDAVGRYRISGELGSGGMGVVYRAFDETLHRQVALKLVRPDLLANAGDTDPTGRLLREARALAALSHPNVVTVFDAGQLDGRVFVATELVQGRNVSEWVADEAPTLEAVIDVYRQAGHGIAAAHEAGIVHRDIKPDNILVGDDGRVRVADFGLATGGGGRASVRHLASSSERVLDSADVDARAATIAHTISGAIVGTPLYMAPEQLEGTAPDPRSDQFSFCVSLYESRYRKRPFAGRTLGEITSNVLDERVRPVELANESARALHAVICRGLAPDPSQRYPSMKALLGALEQVGPETVEARPRRSPLRWIAAAAAATALAAGGFYVARNRGAKPVPARTSHATDAGVTIAAPIATRDAAPVPMAAASHAKGAATPAAPVPTKRRPVKRGPVAPRPAAAPTSPAPSKPAPPPAINLTSKQESAKLYVAAAQRANARDGRGCLATFSKADAMGHKPPYDVALVRARCHMMGGQCGRGKKLHAAFLHRKGLGQVAIDTEVAREARFFCRADQGPWATRLERITHQTPGSRASKSVAVELTTALLRVVRDAGGALSGSQRIAVYHASRTLADAQSRFGRCAAARGVWQTGLTAYPAGASQQPPRSPALAACLAKTTP